MNLIPTTLKEKLPQGFSYPLGAQLLSDALKGVPQFALLKVHYSWKDVFWASEYNKLIEARGSICVLEVSFFHEWNVRVHAVPSPHAMQARERLCGYALPKLRAVLERIQNEPEHFNWQASYDLSSREFSITG